MKSKLSLLVLAVFTAISCNNINQTSTSGKLMEVDIAGSMQQLTSLKATDLGKTIKYIPLETTDESLIGRNPVINVFNNKITVTSNNQCMLFDKNSGKYLGNIGHTGDDPEAYSSANCWIDEKTETLYFKQRPNSLVKYNTNGSFLGKVSIPTPPDTPAEYAFSDSIIIGYYNNIMGRERRSLIYFNEAGALIDTVPTLLYKNDLSLGGIESISVLKNKEQYGTSAISGLMILNTYDQKSVYSFPGIPALWKSNKEIHLKPFFNDTIYTVTNRTLEPYLVFNTGKWHWPAEERYDMEISDKKIVITYVLETPKSVLFEYVKNLYDTENAEFYRGIYFKDSKITKISSEKKPIEDDLTDFMPLQPVTCSNQGEYAGIIQVDGLLEWMGENPDTEYTGELSFLNNFDEDMNPVIVLIK